MATKSANHKYQWALPTMVLLVCIPFYTMIACCRQSVVVSSHNNTKYNVAKKSSLLFNFNLLVINRDCLNNEKKKCAQQQSSRGAPPPLSIYSYSNCRKFQQLTQSIHIMPMLMMMVMMSVMVMVANEEYWFAPAALPFVCVEQTFFVCCRQHY